MSRVLRQLVACAALGALALGCAGSVKRGSALYADGNYIEAAAVFEHTEPQLAEMDARERAEYGLYRGLTLLVLGDNHGAQRWFGYAESQDQAGVLRPETRELLDRGLVELDRSRQPRSPVSGPPNTAVAASQPAASVIPERD